MPAPSSTLSHSKKKAQLGSDDDGERVIDGVRFPRRERQIDQLGFETTKHGLHFHGADWDIPLTQRRDDLTKKFESGAAEATGEPVENIQNLRFVMNDGYLNVRFTVRHKASIPVEEIQDTLSKFDWKDFKSLYEPREKKAKSLANKNKPARQSTSESLGVTRRVLNLNDFGRVCDPQFHDASDHDEEPVTYEEREAAKARRTNSHVIPALRFA